MLVRMLVRSPDDAWVPMCRVVMPGLDGLLLLSARTTAVEASTDKVKTAVMILLREFMAESFCVDGGLAGGEISPASPKNRQALHKTVTPDLAVISCRVSPCMD